MQIVNAQKSDVDLASAYFSKGDKRKAIELYAELSKKEMNISLIYGNYMDAMIELGMYSEAQSFLKKIFKNDPNNILYQLDFGFLYVRTGDMAKADRYIKELISVNRQDIYRIKLIADYFTSKSLTDYAIQSLTESRKFLDNKYMFCLELASLYRIQGDRDKMVREYLTYVTQSAGNIQYVKNIMQTLLTKPEELESLEKLLYEEVQQKPNEEVYSDLLIWVTMQQKNFYASFIQGRAYDKRYKKDGEKCIEIARVALDNNDYENAAKIYRYVIREFATSPNYLVARLGLIHTHEASIRNTFPVNADSVKTLINDYKKFIREYPENNNALEAIRNEALLFAKYLGEKDTAVYLLKALINNPRCSQFLQSKTKLDLGDIYLIMGQPWESTLLYSQVEKTQKENPMAYEAKLKNAKLFYYKGDFQLAQAHLDILKEATTREIANDALELSTLIKENIAFDSLGKALKQYSAIQLLLYQNKVSEALKEIQNLKEGKNISSSDILNHSILDDVYWLEANIKMKQGEFDAAINLLQKIRDEFGNDILADDSFFLQGEIFEIHLQNKDKARDIYREFLNIYPGSVYAAEARKRFRILRGDDALLETSP